MRYILDVTYIGTGYSGWQTQPNATTVQGELDKSLSLLLRRPIESMGAGRTDAGVHATQMIVHFDHDDELHPSFVRALNAILPKRIAVNGVYTSPDSSFHARFSAISRAYEYHMVFRKSPMEYSKSWWYQGIPLDFEAMQEGAEIIGQHDSFESFCKAKHNNKTYWCKMEHSYWKKISEHKWVYYVKADRFLRGMVRTIVGTLLLMGQKKLDGPGLQKILDSKNRKNAGMSVFAGGLFLTEVGYPEGMLEPLTHFDHLAKKEERE